MKITKLFLIMLLALGGFAVQANAEVFMAPVNTVLCEDNHDGTSSKVVYVEDYSTEEDQPCPNGVLELGCGPILEKGVIETFMGPSCKATDDDNSGDPFKAPVYDESNPDSPYSYPDAGQIN